MQCVQRYQNTLPNDKILELQLRLCLQYENKETSRASLALKFTLPFHEAPNYKRTECRLVKAKIAANSEEVCKFWGKLNLKPSLERVLKVFKSGQSCKFDSDFARHNNHHKHINFLLDVKGTLGFKHLVTFQT